MDIHQKIFNYDKETQHSMAFTDIDSRYAYLVYILSYFYNQRNYLNISNSYNTACTFVFINNKGPKQKDFLYNSSRFHNSYHY